MPAVSEKGLLSRPPWDPLGLAPSQAWGQEQPSACGVMVPGVVSRRDQGVGVREGPLLHGPGGQDWVGFGVGRPLPSLCTMVVVLGHTCSLWPPLFNPYGGHTRREMFPPLL